MGKIILYNDEARKALKVGVDAVNNAVKITIGPKGRNVILDRGFQSPLITNDGVSIAKEMILTNRPNNMGADIARDVANKTNEKVGDGTSTSVILFQSMLKEGMDCLTTGVNAVALKNGIMKAANYVVDALKRSAIQIEGLEKISQIATISAESKEIGDVVADTLMKVGKDGIVTVEESQTMGVKSEVVVGMKLDKGYVSPYMATDPTKMTAEYSDIAVILTDKKVVTAREMLPILEKIAGTGTKDVFLICDELEGEALSTFIMNKLKGNFNITAIQIPGFGNNKKDLLQDIACMVGGAIFSNETGIDFETGALTSVGKAEKIIVSKDSTIIVGPADNKLLVDGRINMLKEQLKTTEGKIDRQKLEERISRLAGGVAVIKVGAATEAEMKYLKLKIEDAVAATKAAIEEGVVVGGGCALLKIANEMVSEENTKEGDLGFDIVKMAICAPFKQILINTGKTQEDIDLIVENILKDTCPDYGYDALIGGEVENMIQSGIVDPVKVTRIAVENAASAAGALLTTEVIVCDEPIIKEK